MSDDLVTWLRQQIEIDEAAAGEVHRLSCDSLDVDAGVWAGSAPADCDCGWPSRVLAEVEAKRRILDRYEAAARRAAMNPGYHAVARLEHSLAKVTAPELERVVRLLALPYAANAGFREEWRP